MSISASVDKLIDYAKANLGLAPENEICARNAVLDILGSPDYAYTGEKSRASSPDEVLKELLAECASQGIEGADDEEDFDYDAAAHPSENLGQILRDLGLMFGDDEK